MGIAIPLLLILLTCLFIWRACDGFEVASEYIGRNLSDGVRGGTINAIASSIPELFTTLIALIILADTEGFSVGIGTTAGSALFNGMIIPAVCIFAVVGATIAGRHVSSVNVQRRVLLRDGLSLIACELVLILMISGNELHWWHGAILIGMYGAYLTYMLKSMRDANSEEDEPEDEEDPDDEEVSGLGRLFYWLSLGPVLDLESHFIGEKEKKAIAEEKWNGWPLLITATAVIGAACWLLVHACEWLGSESYSAFGREYQGLNMPTMFVAVIFAAMATSVPDTIISIRDAKDGDYDDAVANALGSNIFDICFALGFPLMAYTLLNGSLQMSPEVASASAELRLLLFGLTVVGFLIYYMGPRVAGPDGDVLVPMGRGKALLLLTVYLCFVAYIVALGANAAWAESVSAFLSDLRQQFLIAD